MSYQQEHPVNSQVCQHCMLHQQGSIASTNSETSVPSNDFPGRWSPPLRKQEQTARLPVDIEDPPEPRSKEVTNEAPESSGKTKSGKTLGRLQDLVMSTIFATGSHLEELQDQIDQLKVRNDDFSKRLAEASVQRTLLEETVSLTLDNFRPDLAMCKQACTSVSDDVDVAPRVSSRRSIPDIATIHSDEPAISAKSKTTDHEEWYYQPHPRTDLPPSFLKFAYPEYTLFTIFNKSKMQIKTVLYFPPDPVVHSTENDSEFCIHVFSVPDEWLKLKGFQGYVGNDFFSEINEGAQEVIALMRSESLYLNNQAFTGNFAEHIMRNVFDVPPNEKNVAGAYIRIGPEQIFQCWNSGHPKNPVTFGIPPSRAHPERSIKVYYVYVTYAPETAQCTGCRSGAAAAAGVHRKLRSADEMIFHLLKGPAPHYAVKSFPQHELFIDMVFDGLLVEMQKIAARGNILHSLTLGDNTAALDHTTSSHGKYDCTEPCKGCDDEDYVIKLFDCRSTGSHGRNANVEHEPLDEHGSG